MPKRDGSYLAEGSAKVRTVAHTPLTALLSEILLALAHLSPNNRAIGEWCGFRYKASDSTHARLRACGSKSGWWCWIVGRNPNTWVVSDFTPVGSTDVIVSIRILKNR